VSLMGFSGSPDRRFSLRAAAVPPQACSGGGKEERAVRRATTVGRGAKPPAESESGVE
jgi:hypothetical protein